jgi:hypothetical protein
MTLGDANFHPGCGEIVTPGKGLQHDANPSSVFCALNPVLRLPAWGW